MNGMRVLISPLSWGFGHAGRMIPLALALKRRGCEVIFAADALLTKMIAPELPDIKTVVIPGLTIRYSRFMPQYLTIFLQLPVIVASAVREHATLRRLAKELNPMVIISDNRFGFYHKKIFSVYITHQVRIAFPAFLAFLEPLAAWMHRMIISRYDLCLVPDYRGSENLSGRLSHGGRLPANVAYIGPLSRFGVAGSEPSSPARAKSVPPGPGRAKGETVAPGQMKRMSFAANRTKSEPVAPGQMKGEPLQTGQTENNPLQPGGGVPPAPPAQPYVCLILSGPEPQRSLLLRKVSESLREFPLTVLSATPPQAPTPPEIPTPQQAPTLPEALTPPKTPPPPGQAIHLITGADTTTMRQVITGASMVIARAGYTSVMELVSLGKGAVLIPTPGQTEQQYLGRHLDGRYGFITMNQNRLERLASVILPEHKKE
ncbi:MAG TPA: glycosyltransferase [Bacteroidales bacterium]|nr:glycosyltransferase [Bacteroidales bacterium]